MNTSLTTSSLGDLERSVMEQVWASAPVREPGHEGSAAGDVGAGVTVRAVHEAVGQPRGLAYTTLLTVMQRLAKKGVLFVEKAGRAHAYWPAVSRDALTAHAVRSTAQQIGTTDRLATVLHFLDDATPAELSDLRSALDRLEARQGRHVRA